MRVLVVGDDFLYFIVTNIGLLKFVEQKYRKHGKNYYNIGISTVFLQS